MKLLLQLHPRAILLRIQINECECDASKWNRILDGEAHKILFINSSLRDSQMSPFIFLF